MPSKWFSFFEGFTVPLFRRLFEAMLLVFGPACAPRVFTTTPAQNTVMKERSAETDPDGTEASLCPATARDSPVARTSAG